MVQQLDIVVGYNGDVTANWDVPPGQSNIAIGENPQPMGIVPWLKLSEDSHKTRHQIGNVGKFKVPRLIKTVGHEMIKGLCTGATKCLQFATANSMLGCSEFILRTKLCNSLVSQ